MLTARDYILEQLRSLGTLTLTPTFASEKDQMDFLCKSILSKKFRKYAVSPAYQDHIRSAIELNVRSREPIKITLVFGGYKLWRLAESPEVDWAELFSLIYYAKWVKPICDAYSPGVWFDFYSDDAIVERINNTQKEDTRAYAAGFQKLLDFLKPFLPSNLRFTFNRVGAQYASSQEFDADLQQQVAQMHAKFKDGFPKLTESQIGAIDLNVRLKPGQEADPKWREEVQLVHDAYTLVSKRRPYYRTADKIVAITKQLDKTIAVGTTKTSVIKFWIGVGALKKTSDGFIETVLSPGQLEKVPFDWESITIPGLTGRNFERVRIVS